MRIVGLLIILATLNNYSFAQNNDKGRFKIYSKLGIQAGGPLYHSETIVSKKGSPGFNPLGGLGVSYRLYKGLGVGTEIFYSRRKIKYSSNVKEQPYTDKQFIIIDDEPIEFDIETTFTGNTKGSFDIQYLELPLLIQYQISQKVLIQAGPYYAWAFKRTNKGTATGIVGRTDIDDPSRIENKEYDNTSHVNFRYWGLLGGVQYKIFSRLNADFRMTYSFKSLYDKNWQGVNYSLKDLYGQLSVCYVLFQNK